ncbi:hypothetical protein FACS1894158_05130 [Betaproteobacteria bacterium]|nr:hypothetical protein FACS1894158_05130 [Betaproteobacteria bacterium]
MASSKRFGLFALFSGTLAIPTAVVATYLQSIRIPGSGMVLDWLGKIGLVSTPEAPTPVIYIIESVAPDLAKMGLARGQTVVVSGVPEMREMNPFAVNDENAILFLFFISMLLAALAITSALWAEYRRESGIFLSVGYICGALALFLIRPLFGLIACVFGIMAILLLRLQRETPRT